MRAPRAVVVGIVALTACNPAINRTRGEVTQVRDRGDEIEICVVGAKDAGSSYGDKTPNDGECRHGIPDGALPRVGNCVVLQIQGEGSELKVESSHSCNASP